MCMLASDPIVSAKYALLTVDSVDMRSLIRFFYKGIARTQSPTNKNGVLKLLTFGTIVGVNFI